MPKDTKAAVVISTFTPDMAITITRMQLQVLKPLGGCQDLTLIVSNGVTGFTLPILALVNDSGPLTSNMPAGIPITLTLAGVRCKDAPADGNIVVQYKSQ